MTDKKIRIILDSSKAKANADQLNKSVKGVGSSAEGASFSMNKLAVAIASVVSVQKVVQYADAWTRVENQLKRTTSSQEDLNATSLQLLQISNQTRSALEPTVELYTSLSVATRNLKVSQSEIAGVTKTINNLFLESGKGASETAGAIRQLGQALESGALRGDEFNSVAEGAPGILLAIEAQTGLTREELRELAAQGKITAELIVQSLSNYEKQAQDAADKTRVTLSQAWEVAGNNATYLIGRLDQATGASSGLANAIVSITNAIADPATLNNIEAFGKIIGIGIGETVERVSAELRYFARLISDPFDGESRAAAWQQFQEDVRAIGQVTSDSIDLLVAEKIAIENVAKARADAANAPKTFGTSPTPISLGGATSDGSQEIAGAKAVTAALQAELALRQQVAQIYSEGVLAEDASLYSKQLALIDIRQAEELARIEIRAAEDQQRRSELLAKELEDKTLSDAAKLQLQYQYNEQVLLSEQILEEQRTQILQEGKQAREELDRAEFQTRLAMVGQLGDKIMEVSKGKSKGIFKIGQTLALAQAAVSLPAAVLESFKNGGGYPWGLIPAGLMLANGLQQINAIKNAGKGLGGGGGSVSVPSIGGGGGGSSGIPTTAQQVELTQQKRIIDLRGVASTDKLTVAQFAALMEEDGAIVTLENARIDAERRNVIGVTGR